jgi:hypothetical protein
MSIPTIRKYFFASCQGFSVWFPPLLSAEGPAFRRDCTEQGKKLVVWTVNDAKEMKECLRWGDNVEAIITDRPDVVLGLAKKVGGALQCRLAQHFSPVVPELMLSFQWSRPSVLQQSSRHRASGKCSSPGRRSLTIPSDTWLKRKNGMTILRPKAVRLMTICQTRGSVCSIRHFCLLEKRRCDMALHYSGSYNARIEFTCQGCQFLLIVSKVSFLNFYLSSSLAS